MQFHVLAWSSAALPIDLNVGIWGGQSDIFQISEVGLALQDPC